MAAVCELKSNKRDAYFSQPEVCQSWLINASYVTQGFNCFAKVLAESDFVRKGRPPPAKRHRNGIPRTRLSGTCQVKLLVDKVARKSTSKLWPLWPCSGVGSVQSVWFVRSAAMKGQAKNRAKSVDLQNMLIQKKTAESGSQTPEEWLQKT